jgi:hypothetical protein
MAAWCDQTKLYFRSAGRQPDRRLNDAPLNDAGSRGPRRPTPVVLDVHLPDLSGYTAATGLEPADAAEQLDIGAARSGPTWSTSWTSSARTAVPR